MMSKEKRIVRETGSTWISDIRKENDNDYLQ